MQGINKATGVKKLLSHMQLEGSQMMALGDGDNDRDMLEMAAVRMSIAQLQRSVPLKGGPSSASTSSYVQ